MRRLLSKPIGIFVIAFIVYLAVSLAEEGEATFASVKVTLGHESARVALYVAVGAVLIALMTEAMGERLLPVIQDSLRDLSQLVAYEVGKGIVAGFGRLATTISTALDAEYTQSWKQVRKRAEDPQEPQEEKEIATLLLSNEKKDLDRAAGILAQRQIAESNYVRTIKNYTTLAYKFWSMGFLIPAIDSAKNGLELAAGATKAQGAVATSQNLAELESALKNSLAYYYAETGKAEFEDLARQYASESLAGHSHKWERLDTQGFVWIVYGKTKEEIVNGLKMCADALPLGLPVESYQHDFERATVRLKAFDQSTSS